MPKFFAEYLALLMKQEPDNARDLYLWLDANPDAQEMLMDAMGPAVQDDNPQDKPQ